MPRDLPASAFLVLGLKADVTRPSLRKTCRYLMLQLRAGGLGGGGRVGGGKYRGEKPPRDCYLLDRGVASSFSSHSL